MVICDVGCVFSTDDGTDCTALNVTSGKDYKKDYISINCEKCKFFKSKTEYRKKHFNEVGQRSNYVVERA